MDDNGSRGLAEAGYRPAGAEETVRGNRRWWDDATQEYLDEHGDFLGDDDFVWCPEGLREADAGLLGAPDRLAGARVLEVGSGAAQCARWLAARGAHVAASDLSGGMLAAARRLGAAGDAAAGNAAAGNPAAGNPAAGNPAAGDDLAANGGATSATTGSVGLVQADARVLPFADASFDVAFSAYGAVPFVADPERVMAEVARVLRPGGRWVFSVSHPVRWAFPDDPTEHGLTATRSYFDRTPYVEQDEDGEVVYAEHHRTLGDRVRDVVAAGLVLVDLVEPEWPDGHDRVWGGWSPLRGRLLPGTAILVTRRP